MDVRPRRNQLAMLLKKRTYISDNELFEMMRSRQVYQVQTELRKELDRNLQALKRAEKLQVSGFLAQRAVFLRKIQMMEKNKRLLVNVRVAMNSQDDADVEESQTGSLNNLSGPGSRSLGEEGVIQNEARDHGLNVFANAPQITTQAPSAMSERNSDNGNLDKPEVIVSSKNTDSIHDTIIKPVEYEACKGTKDSKQSNDNQIKSQSGKELTASDENAKRKDINNCVASQSSKSPKRNVDKHKLFEGNFSDDAVIFQVEKANKSVFRKLPLINIENHSASETEQDKIDKRETTPSAGELERTVTMIFVEEFDTEDSPPKSQFDLEAWLTYNKRKRGYSKIIDAFPLHIVNKNTNGVTSEDEKGTTKSKIRLRFSKYKNLSGQGPKTFRDKSKEWYLNFVRSKSQRKKNKTIPQNEFEFPRGITVLPRLKPETGVYCGGAKMRHGSLAKETVDQKLQKMKDELKSLEEKVHNFVAS